MGLGKSIERAAYSWVKTMRKLTCLLLVLVLTFSLFTLTAFADGDKAEQENPIPVSTLDIATVPDYTGSDYIVLNDNVSDFYLWQITKTPYVRFSAFDELGRTGAGMACLGKETLPAEVRGEIGDIRPTGWHTERYDDLIEDRYLYNRAHVLGYMLSSDNNTPENLFTGTRYLNAGSMLQFEITVGDYIEKTGNHVIYRVTPMYRGRDLVATGVQMEAWSVEDSGAGVCFNVFVYNVQPGILIDYATGDSKCDPDYVPSTAAPVLPLFVMGDVDGDVPDRSMPAEEAEPSEAPTVTYVLNTNTHKFHLPTCPSVTDMKPKNREDFYGTRDEAIAAGYQPCGRCHP